MLNLGELLLNKRYVLRLTALEKLHDEAFIYTKPQKTLEAREWMRNALGRYFETLESSEKQETYKALKNAFYHKDKRGVSGLSSFECIEPLEFDHPYINIAESRDKIKFLGFGEEVTHYTLRPAVLSDEGCERFAEILALEDADKAQLRSLIQAARMEWDGFVRSQMIEEAVRSDGTFAQFLALLLLRAGQRDARSYIKGICMTFLQEPLCSEHPEYHFADNEFSSASYYEYSQIAQKYPLVFEQLAKNTGITDDAELMQALRHFTRSDVQKDYDEKQMKADIQTVNVFIEHALFAVSQVMNTKGAWVEWLNITPEIEQSRPSWQSSISAAKKRPQVDLTLSAATLLKNWPDIEQVQRLADSAGRVPLQQKVHVVDPSSRARRVDNPYTNPSGFKHTMPTALLHSFQAADQARSRLMEHGHAEALTSAFEASAQQKR